MTEGTQQTRKDAVADAALTVALRSGLEGAGLREIAREAGCTTGLVTHYFRDKKAVITYALERNISRFFAGLAVELGKARTGRDRLAALMGYLGHAGDPTTSGVMFRSLASAPVNAEIAARLRDAYDRVHELARSAVADGRTDGSLPGSGPVHDVADIAVAMADGLYVAGVARPAAYGPERRDALIATMIDALRS